MQRFLCAEHSEEWEPVLAQGTSDEVALLVAEFALLDGPISAFAEVVEKGEAGRINEDELARLAVEIPDLRMRLGIG